MTRKRKAPEKKPPPKEEIPDNLITMLTNAQIYFIDYALIVLQDKQWRLVVSRHGKIYTDKLYPTLKGARMGFIKLCWVFAFSTEYKPEWTHLYVAGKKWLAERVPSSTPQNPDQS